LAFAAVPAALLAAFQQASRRKAPAGLATFCAADDDLSSGDSRIFRRRLAVLRSSRTTSLRMGLSEGAQFPSDALEKLGVLGKKAVIFFFGQDDAPSCSKQIAAFDANFDAFTNAGVSVVGVRSNAFALTRYPVKSGSSKLSFVVDEDDAIRKRIDIKADFFGFLGGRETYVVDAAGKVVAVHNSQLDVDSHVNVALDAINTL
jgi:peroxiredoxin Q/BCP